MNPVSSKRREQLKIYYALVEDLRVLCGNKSELSGKSPDWTSNFLIEPHHIDGRTGDRLLNPFGIIMVVREEHTAIQENRSDWTREKLLRLVLPLRIGQGFRQEHNFKGDKL